MHVLWCTFQYSSSNKKGVLIKHDANKSVAIFLVLLLINWICENKKDHNHKNKTCLFCPKYLIIALNMCFNAWQTDQHIERKMDKKIDFTFFVKC